MSHGLERMVEDAKLAKLIEDAKRHVMTEDERRERSIAESISRSQQEDEAKYNAWYLGDYIETGCENCGRQRVCRCPNGKHRCEKCNWVPEDQAYAPVSNH